MSPSPPRERSRVPAAVAAGLVFAGAAALLLAPADFVIGSPRADVAQQFLAWRAFAAGGLRAGRLPLWNPFCYAGEPFVGGFQSAVFYPPNLLFLCAPLCRAMNLSLLLHLAILGWGMARWAAERGLGPWAGALGGFVLALSGPVFPHVYAGHLPNLCTMAWAPWIFAGLEECHGKGRWRGAAVASAAVALQVLAGQVQYVFYTAVAVALHAAVRFATAPESRRRIVPAVALAYLGAAALAAVQIVPGWDAAAEGLRRSGLDAGFAGQFSFPPENLLTALAPGFFGDSVRHLYWGRGYPWEMCLFMGVAGLGLAAIAAADPESGRSARTGLALAGLLAVLALGRHTPLFSLLRGAVPGFDRFRGWSKFAFPASLFAALAIAQGADALLRGRLPRRALPLAALGIGGVLLGAGLRLAKVPRAIGPLLARARQTDECFLPAAEYERPGMAREAGIQAGRSLLLGGGLAVLFGAGLLAARARRLSPRLVLLLLPLEMTGFAATEFSHFRESEAVPPLLHDYLVSHPGDYRVQNLLEPNNGYLLGAPDLWGNDPALTRRYAEFMTFTQGGNPNQATQNVAFHAPNPLYGMLRLRFVFSRTAAGVQVYDLPGAMDRVQLVSDYRVLPDRDRLFAALAANDFDPRRTVLLESEPEPRPAAGLHSGRARVVAAEPDGLTVEADVEAPSLLLLTDGYSRDWSARPLAGSSQARYRVMPANYILRATPLAAGHHLIRFEYRPPGLAAGAAISLLAWLLWAVLAIRAGSSSPEGPTLPTLAPDAQPAE